MTIVANNRYIVRNAESSDIPWLMQELKKFSQFIGTKRDVFGDEQYTKQGIDVLMKKHVLFVSDAGHGPVGFVGGLILPHPMNPTIIILTQMFWWVEEQHRGSRAGLLLLNRFVEYGRQHANWIAFSLEAKSPVNESALIRRGFRLNEHSYLMEVN